MTLSFLFVEVALRAAAWASPRVAYHLSPPWTRNIVPDDVLGKRQSPFYPDHDWRGYRNDRRLDACEILAVGDSTTYGYAAPPEGSWPAHLERLTGKVTYNAGVGSYSPPEYEAVLEELLVLRPRLVILGLFPTNDLSGAYQSVYEEGRFRPLASADAATLRALGRPSSAQSTPRETAEPSKAAQLSATYRLVRSFVQLMTKRTSNPQRLQANDSFAGSVRRPGRYGFDSVKGIRTVFMPAENAAMRIDLDDPTIQEGWRITRVVLRSIASNLERHGIAFMVVVIPSKRSVYADVMARYHRATAADLRHIELEARMTSRILEFLAVEAIAYDYPLPALRAALESATPLYPESDDGHPNSRGYLAIASSMRPMVERLLPPPEHGR